MGRFTASSALVVSLLLVCATYRVGARGRPRPRRTTRPPWVTANLMDTIQRPVHFRLLGAGCCRTSTGETPPYVLADTAGWSRTVTECRRLCKVRQW